MDAKQLLGRAMDALDSRWPADDELVTGEYMEAALSEMAPGLELDHLQVEMKEKAMVTARRVVDKLAEGGGRVSDGHLAAVYMVGALEGFLLGLQYADERQLEQA